jgi:hypothetical protein
MTRHLIDELVFDIAIDSRNRTMQDDAYLSRLVTATLLPVVEEVFEGFDDGDTVLVLDSLEIDLGDIVQADYEDTAVKRLRAALDDALHRALAAARQTRGAGGVAFSAGGVAIAATIVSRQESELAQLGRFLDTGTMPWHADIDQVRLHEALLDRLLAHGGAGLWAVLARALADPRSARRLVGQFPEHQLLAVLRGSAGARAAQFEAWLAELKQQPSAAGLPAAAWVQVLAACTAADDTDANVQAACARIRTALAPSAIEAGASSCSDIDLLAHFLDSGVLRLASDSPDQPAHEALLDRLLKNDGDDLRAVLARALAHPRGARRFAEQFPERQLLAVLRRMAGAGAAQFESLLEEATHWPSVGGEGAPAAIWVRVLAACTESAGIDAQAQCARIRACLAHPADNVAAPSISDIDLLAHFLDSGQLPAGLDSLTGPPAHELLLQRLLKRGEDSLWAVLARALADPRSAQRLVAQFPEAQLLAIVRSTAGARAEPFETLLAEAKFASTAWVRVLVACTGRAGVVDVEAACARIRAAFGRSADDAGASSMSDVDLLAGFLDSGQLLRAAGGAVGQPGHEALLDRLLAHGTPDAGGPVLTHLPLLATAASVGAPRPAERFAGNQLLSLPSQAAPVASVRRPAVLAAAGAGAASAAITTWRRLRADSRQTRLARAKNGAAAKPVQSLPEGTHALLGLLTGFLAGARLAAAPYAAPGVAAHEALLGRMLAQEGAAVWTALARALASPASARRLVDDFPEHQVRAVMQHLAPAQAMQLESLLTQIDRNPDPVISKGGCAAHEALPAAGQVSRAVPLQDDTAARTDDQPRASDDALERTSGQGAQSYRVQLRHLLRFLETGLWPPRAAAGIEQERSHEALLDEVTGHADDALWRIVAHALERGDSAARLLTQFPQRQLIALGRKSAPGYAPALERLVQRLSAMPADGSAAGDARQAEVCRRHALAACVARPPIKALPALVYARVALEPGGTAAPATHTSYARRLDPRPADATMAWRASQGERGAALALVRLVRMIGQFRPLIDDSGESTPAPADAPIVPASGPGLVLREREHMARWLHDEYRALEAMLSAETAHKDAPGAARFADVSTLRTAIAAQVGANPAIAPRRREMMLASIEEKLEEAADPVRFLHGVLALVMTGAPLDLDALLAPQNLVAIAPETPAHQLAAALKSGDAVAVSAHWQAVLRCHAPQIRAGLRHYGRNAAVRRALAQALPEAIFIDLAGLLDGGAPAILRELLTPSAPLQDAVGRGAAWTEWTMRCRLHALTTLTGTAAGERRMEAGAFLRGVAPAAADSQNHAKLLRALSAQFAAASWPAAHLETASTPAPQPGSAATPAQHQPHQSQQPQQQSRASRVHDAAAPGFPEPVDSTELLVVGNAGMVLAGPYLPRLFTALGLTADGKFIDEHAAGRAVHLLQYMVTGESHSPEYLLVLNKILCGLPTAAPVAAGIDITQAEQKCIEGMIQAMVAHAKVLGSCSVAAMRQTFFARTADLRLVEDTWRLRVHPGPFDMLLDRLPWGYSIIKFGWMTRPVHVEWRPT